MLPANVRPASLVRVSLVSGTVAFGCAVLAAIALAVMDIYVTGHGQPSLTRPWISWFGAVELSRADMLMLLAALGGGLGGYLLARDH